MEYRQLGQTALKYRLWALDAERLEDCWLKVTEARWSKQWPMP